MSTKRSPIARKPVSEQAEYNQRIRNRRSSAPQKDEPKPLPKANYGEWSRRPIEVALTQHANLGPGRRYSSASGSDEQLDIGAIRKHLVPPREKPDEENELVPEKLNLKAHVDGADGPGTDQKQSLEQSRETVTGRTSGERYEPGCLLRQNAEYLDLDQDGRGIPSSYLVVFVLHSIFSYPTCPGYIPDPYIRIRYDHTRHRPHDGETTTPRGEKGEPGRSQACDTILAEYDSGNKGGLTIGDILRFWNEQRSQLGVYECCIMVLEWTILYIFLHPHDGILRSDDIRAAFDGSILYRQAESHQRKTGAEAHRKHQHETGSGTEPASPGGEKTGERSNTVKLALVIAAGVAILIWLFRT
ncbi:hypothetical protein GGR54DRAFT_651227 [Hypoxylon sp. NC1633]|nr:hypothetical protein GGR54DRAFT_651227 [Hypoxylon sp. NC1633]